MQFSWIKDLLRDKKRSSSVVLEQMKKDFISHVSHELKAPLASMQETTHLLLERIPGPLTEKQERLLQLNLESGKRLAAMIGNILDLSKLHAGVVDYEMQLQNVAEIADAVVTDLRPHALGNAQNIVLDVPTMPMLAVCDPNRLTQVLKNLLDNAVRFSSKGSFVQVRISEVTDPPALAPRLPLSPDGFILIAVSDSGPGIDDVQKEGIFTSFHQVKQGKKTLGQSLGLGLAISRALVEAHRGTIWVEDNTNGGSVFCVLLPRVLQEGRFGRAS